MSPSDSEPSTAAVTTPVGAPVAAPAGWGSRLESILLRRMLLIGGLYVLVMIGMFLTNVDHPAARFYWSAMFPIFGVVSTWNELAGGRSEHPAWKLILYQALHWLGPIIAVRIIFLQLVRGQMDADAVALVTLVILAVTCFLAGVHLDRSFYWVSVVLAIAAVFGTEVEAYFWFFVAVSILAVAVTLFAATALRRRAESAAG